LTAKPQIVDVVQMELLDLRQVVDLGVELDCDLWVEMVVD